MKIEALLYFLRCKEVRRLVGSWTSRMRERETERMGRKIHGWESWGEGVEMQKNKTYLLGFLLSILSG